MLLSFFSLPSPPLPMSVSLTKFAILSTWKAPIIVFSLFKDLLLVWKRTPNSQNLLQKVWCTLAIMILVLIWASKLFFQMRYYFTKNMFWKYKKNFNLSFSWKSIYNKVLHNIYLHNKYIDDLKSLLCNLPSK